MKKHQFIYVNSNLIYLISSVWFGFYFILQAFYSLNFEYPFNTFLFRPGELFGDTFRHLCFFCSSSTPYFGWLQHDRIFNPFLYFFGILCNKSKWFVVIIYLLSIVGFIFIFIINLNDRFKFFIFDKKKIVIQLNKLLPPFLLVSIILSSYPFLITLNRMNFDMVSFTFLCVYLLSKSNLRFIFLALSISLKIINFYFLLIPLFLGESFRKVIGVFFIALFLNYTSLFFFYNTPIDSLTQFISNLIDYNRYYTEELTYGIFSQSIFNIISLPYTYCSFLNTAAECSTLSHYVNFLYMFCLLLCMASIGIVFYKNNIPSLYKITFLIIIFILFQKTSPAYREIYMILPFFLFFLKNQWDYNDRIIFALVSLILFPKNISTEFFGKIFPAELHITYILDPLILLALFLFIFTISWKSNRNLSA